MNPSPLSALLVDDEPLCRADFRHILRAFPDIRLTGEADSLTAARKYLATHSVDLLFLDLSLGRENGLDLLEKFPFPPLTIALTAHPQHAVRGFALNLVDYILKPVEESRLRVAVAKALHRRISTSFQSGKISILVEMNGKKTLLEPLDILSVQSMGNYVVFQTHKGKGVRREAFKRIRQKLPPPYFLQISRGYLIARHLITSWERDAWGRLLLHLASGPPIRVSHSQAPQVLKILIEGQKDLTVA